jgi:hypothetical protein
MLNNLLVHWQILSTTADISSALQSCDNNANLQYLLGNRALKLLNQ